MKRRGRSNKQKAVLRLGQRLFKIRGAISLLRALQTDLAVSVCEPETIGTQLESIARTKYSEEVRET